MKEKINILYIDDHELVAKGVKDRIKKVLPDATFFFSDNVRSAYAILHQNEIDLIISDLEFENEPQFDGFYIAQKILELEPKAKIIALTHYNSYRIMKKAKSIGFKSFLNKGCSFKEFSDTIINVINNGDYESITEKKLKRKRLKISQNIFNESLKGISFLSKRELELILFIQKTTDRKELAKLMNLNTYTIDSHLKNIYSKLYLNNKKELAIFATDFSKELEKELKSKL